MLTVREALEKIQQDERRVAVSLIITAFKLVMIDTRRLSKSHAQQINEEKGLLIFYGTIHADDAYDKKKMTAFVSLWMLKNGTAHARKILEDKSFTLKDIQIAKLQAQAILDGIS